MRRLFVPIILFLLTSLPAFAQTAEILHTFQRSVPATINSGLARAPDGRLYGISTSGLLRVDPGGAVTIVHAFSQGEIAQGGSLGLQEPMVASDGTVYGLTDTGGTHRAGSLFGFVPSTGAFRTVYSFPRSWANGPTSTFVEASGGLLYGTVLGQLWRIDPASGAATVLATASATGWVAVGTVLYGTNSLQLVRFDTASTTTTVLHTLPGAGRHFVDLVRATDGLIFGAVGVTPTNGPEPPGQVAVLDPSTDALSIVDIAALEFNAAPVEASDGHLYGVASVRVQSTPSSSTREPTIYRLRRSSGGGLAYELFPGTPTYSIGSLALSTDGFMYGVIVPSQIFRFDPLARGSAGDEFQFAIVHVFSGGDGLSGPSTPLAGADGFLYGLLTKVEASVRTLVAYRLNPTTAALELKGGFPDEFGTNLVEGAPGILYRVSSAIVAGGMRRTRVFRLEGASGAVSAVLDQIEPAGEGNFLSRLVRAPDGKFVGLR